MPLQNGIFDKLIELATNRKKAMSPPDDQTAAGIKAKVDNIAEYNKAVTPAPESAKPPMTPVSVDKVKPKAKYGDKKGEERIDTTGMTSYKKGTTRVPKTGAYKLHKGEAVIPAENNPMNPYDKITEGQKPKKVIHEIRTRKAKSGGYIHEHHHTEPMHHPMEEHTTSDIKGMLSHMADHMGEGEPGEEKGESSATEAQEQAIGME